ncbi:FkbM family methyltransferase [Candidatus Peregrinibacteria bacterium]|nr:FkbM family methyltransferase [Candidatus Peregrinibacteria bacterium]
MKEKKIVYNGVSLLVNMESDADASVLNEIFVEREYRILEPIIQNSKGVVVDIGAHIGLFCLYVRAFNRDVKIYAFEPGSGNFQLLKKNLKRNHFEKNIIAKNLAVAGEEGTCELYLSPDSHNHSLLKFGTKLGTEKVGAVSLSKILDKTGVVDLIKMDCEGAEFEIIRSLKKHDFERVKNFYLEYHKYSPELNEEEIKDILMKNSYKVKVLPSHYDRRLGFIFGFSAI